MISPKGIWMGKKARNRCFVCHTEFKQREGGEQRCPECHSRTVARLAKPSVATAGAASPAKRSKHDGESEGEQRADNSARTEGASLAFASERRCETPRLRGGCGRWQRAFRHWEQHGSVLRWRGRSAAG